MKGINEDQWEDDEHDKDFSTTVNDRRCGKIFQCLNLKYCIHYNLWFEPFISFLSITWTRPTLQLLNKALLEVLLNESTYLALTIFSLGLRRKITQDYQATGWYLEKTNFTNSQVTQNFFFPDPQSFTLFAPNIKWLLREQISKFSKIFKSSNIGFFPFLLVPNMCDPQAFHSFDCLWRLNLKFFQNEEANLIICF